MAVFTKRKVVAGVICVLSVLVVGFFARAYIFHRARAEVMQEVRRIVPREDRTEYGNRVVVEMEDASLSSHGVIVHFRLCNVSQYSKAFWYLWGRPGYRGSQRLSGEIIFEK